MEKVVIVRTVVLVVALVNQLLVMAGLSPIPYGNEEVEVAVTSILTVGATLWAWYKNNSFTKEAQEADKVMKELKKGKKTK